MPDLRKIGVATAAPWLAAVLLAGTAEVYFRSHRLAIALPLSALALVLGGLVGRSWDGPRWEAETNQVRRRPRLLLGSTLALSIALILQHGERAYAAQLLSWATAVVLLNLAFAGARRRMPSGTVVAAMLVLAVAVVARIWDLEHVPGGFYGDEGEFGMYAVKILDGERVAPFGSGWDKHPTLFSYIQAASLSAFGQTIAAVRLPSAVAGALTVVPLFLLLRRHLGIWPALAGGLVFACSPWCIHHSRVASNNAFVGLLTASTMAALDVALRSGSLRAYVAAGSFMGGCIYFGNKAVLLPVMAMVGLGGVLLATEGIFARDWRRWLAAIVSAIFVAAPQLVFYAGSGWYAPLLVHPMTRFIGQQPLAPGVTWAATMVEQVQRSLLAFHVYPDQSIYRSAVDLPFISAAEAALYVVGLGVCLYRIKRPFAAFLLAWFGVGLIASILAQNPPQANRMIGITPLPAAFAALAIAALISSFGTAALRAALALALGVLAAVSGGREYFVGWGRSWPIAEITAVARAMRAMAPLADIVLITPPMSWDRNGTLRFEGRGVVPVKVGIAFDPQAPWPGTPGRDVAFIFDIRQRGELPRVQDRYPGGSLTEYGDQRGRPLAVVYRIPASIAETAEVR